MTTLSAKGLMLKNGTAIDATLIAAPSSTKNRSGERDPELHQTKKGYQWHFGMKPHIGRDADSRLVHTVEGTAANVNDVTQANTLVHSNESDVFADAGHQGVAEREETQGIEANWHVAMRPGKRKALDKATPMGRVLNELEHVKASVRAKVEHPFRVLTARQLPQKCSSSILDLLLRALQMLSVRPFRNGLAPQFVAPNLGRRLTCDSRWAFCILLRLP